MSVDLNNYLCEETVTCLSLDYEESFKSLSEEEKLYMFYLFKAIATGWRITAVQTSFESPYIISIFLRIFRMESGDELKNRLSAEPEINSKAVEAFLIYAYNVLGNMGNYRGFGDTKILPRATYEEFECIIHHTLAYKEDAEGMDRLWSTCGKKIFSHDASELRLGLPPGGVTSYYSQNITQEDIKTVQEFCLARGLECYNNRLFKHDNCLELRFASAAPCVPERVQFQSREIELTGGDYARVLAKVNDYLELAAQHALNDTQRAFLAEYRQSFATGSLEHHVRGSALWTRDQKPSVENYIGFIENYRDPYGVRGEWEGFVAVMNKTYTRILSDLVDQAPTLLKLLPWDEAFEKPVFLKPDFTSIDIVGFFGSGIPAGINIPNYDSVRQNEGFKNVSLGNIINARRSASEKIEFVCDADQALMHRGNEAFSVQVGLHELLGHGSGAMFAEGAIPAGAVNPFSGAAIAHGYKEGETWSSVFTALSNTYEECRAECVGLYLSTFDEVLRVFGYEGAAAEEMMYLNWLHQLHMALVSLQAYNVADGGWSQSHCCARHVYLQVLLRHTQGLVWIEPTRGADGGLTDFVIRVDRTKIRTEGRRAIGDFLLHLQLYKSCAAVEEGTKYFNQFTGVDETFLEYRRLVMERKKPRAVFMQPNLELRDGKVVSVPSDVSISGVIESTVRILGDEVTEEDFLSCVYKE